MFICVNLWFHFFLLMADSNKRFSFRANFITVFLFCLSVTVVNAQDIGVRIPIRKAAQNPRPAATKTIVKTTVKIQRVIVPVKEIKVQTRVVKTSNLTVSTEDKAEVVLESKTDGKQTKKIVSDKGAVEFENLSPGKYQVSANLDGFYSQETDVTIEPQKTVGISLDLEPVSYQLNIRTNITEGEVRYAPARLEGTNADGSLKTVETGGYCIVPVKKGGAMIRELKKGYYNIDIRPSAVEYQPVLTAINVPTEILDEDDPNSKEPQSYQINLEKKISTGTFASAWTTQDWNLPAGWKIENREMKTGGLAGIAVPRNEQYLYYTNFEMISDVLLNNGKSIGFVFRMIDSQNYYVLQISGANAAEPFLATGYVVKNGKPELLFSNPTEHFSKTIKAKKPFRVVIKSEENTFKIFIEDSSNGERLNVGNMIDRDKTFRKGAVGVQGSAGANSDIGFFTVCAGSCS